MSGEGGKRTYSIWVFVALFAVLALTGVALLLLTSGSNGSTVQVAVTQTMPEDMATTTVPESVTTTESTVPGGLPDELPDGVVDVQSQDGTTSYVFDTPAGVDPASLEAVVAPMAVRIDPDGTSATLSIVCARSSEEFLAQVIVTDSDQSVTLAAIALVPPDGPACPPDAEVRSLELVLPRPLTGRAVVVVPAGTEIPSAQPS